jgi:hypothetical protein
MANEFVLTEQQMSELRSGLDDLSKTLSPAKSADSQWGNNTCTNCDGPIGDAVRVCPSCYGLLNDICKMGDRVHSLVDEIARIDPSQELESAKSAGLVSLVLRMNAAKNILLEAISLLSQHCACEDVKLVVTQYLNVVMQILTNTASTASDARRSA